MTFMIDLRTWFLALSTPPDLRSPQNIAIQGFWAALKMLLYSLLKCHLLVPGSTSTIIIFK